MSEDADVKGVVGVDNHIYFYGEVNEANTLEVIKLLREQDATEIYRAAKGNAPVRPIYLHINSPGGAATDSLAIADVIQSLQAPTYSLVEGMAASGGTIISMACSKRIITPRAFMMIHQLSAWPYGTYEQIKDEVAWLDMLMETLVTFYAKHSKQGKKAIRRMLKRDTWVDAQKALDLGFVDEIT